MKLEYNFMNDYFIKKLFHQPKYFKILIKLVTGLDIEQEVIESSFAEIQANAKAKGSRFDILVKFRNTIVDVEGQIEKERTNPKSRKSTLAAHHTRKIHYATQLHSENFKRGEEYEEMKYTIVIFLLDYDIGGKGAIQVSKVTNQETLEAYEDVKIYDVCLKKGKKCDTLELEEFLDVLRTKEQKEYKTPIAKELMELITAWSADDKERFQARLEENYERELATERSLLKKEGIQEGIEQGRAEGRAEGIIEAKQEIVRNLYSNNVDIQTIMKATSLTEEEVKKIISC